VSEFSILRLLNDNEISKVTADGLFGGLPHLKKVDFSRNKLQTVEPNTFEGCAKLTELYGSQSIDKKCLYLSFVAGCWPKTS